MTYYPKYWSEKAETMSPEELYFLQEEKILAKIPYVYQHSKLHRKVWQDVGLEPGDIRSFEDFQTKVPTIDKDMTRAFREETGDPFGGLLCVPPEQCYVTQSSGTTGNPTFSAFTESDYEKYTEIWARGYWALGPNEEGLRPGEYVLAGRPSFHSYSVPIVRAARKIGAVTILQGLDAYSVGQVINYLRRFPVASWFFAPAPILQGMQQTLASTGENLRDLASNMRGVGLAGEVITPPFRKRMEEEFGFDLFITGGSTPEVGTLFSECGEKDEFVHMHGQDFYLSEVTDPDTGKPVPRGAIGEHTVTNFSFDAMPVLRYQTDDLVVEHSEPICSYGRSARRIKFLGRESDRVRVSGKDLFVSQVKAAVEVLPETQEGVFQIIKTSDDMDVLRLRVGYNPEKVKDKNQLMQNVAQQVKNELSIGVECEFATIEELQKLHPYKIPRISKS